MKQRTRTLLLIAVVLLAAVLRFYRIDAQSFWNDEGTSVALALRDLPTITANAANDIHPPLYYYLLHAWVSVLGGSEAGARSLSAIIGIGLVIALYALARRVSSEEAALFAATLCAVNPLLIYYSQEARMYEMAGLWATLSMWALARLFEPPTKADTSVRLTAGRALIWLGITAAGVYTHYFVFAVVAAENAAVLIWLLVARWQDRQAFAWRTLWGWLGLQLALVLTYVPWLLFSWSSLSAWPAVSDPIGILGLTRRVLSVYALGVTAPSAPLGTGLGVAAAVPAALGLLWPLREQDKTGPGQGRTLIATWALVPIVVMYVLSLRQPMYKDKFFIVGVPAFCWLQALGISHTVRWLKQMGVGRLMAGLTAAILLGAALVGPVFSLRNLYWDASYARDDYRGIAAYIQAAATEHSAVLINAPAQVETFDLYYTGQQPVYPLPQQRPMDPDATRLALEELAATHDRIYAILWATDESDPEGIIESWLDQYLFKTMDSWFGNVRLAAYAVPEATSTVPESMVRAQLGTSFLLQGYALAPSSLTSGDILQLTLFWECLASTDIRYKTFVHLLDQQGNIIAQRDSEPMGGSRPTSGWVAGEVIADNYGLLIPAASAPGEYSIRLGMYNGDTGERLQVTLSDGSISDALVVSALQVTLPEAPPPLTALGLPETHDTDWPGLTLVGHGLYRLGFEHADDLELYPADPIKLELYWQRKAGDGLLDWRVQFVRGREVAWETAIEVLDEQLPLSDWPQGYTLLDVQTLHPPALEPGSYTLRLVGGNGQQAELERIRINPNL